MNNSRHAAISILAKGKPPEIVHHRWKDTRVETVPCHNCGKKYLDYKKRLAKSRNHFCTSSCYQEYKKGAGNPNWRGGKTKKICTQCGISFEIVPALARNGEGVFCGRKCKHEAARIYPNKIIMKREMSRRREARVRAIIKLNGTHTRAEWLAVLGKNNGQCLHCGTTENITRDHIIPLSKGGTDTIDNIQPLCHSCNSKKWNKL